MIAVVPPCRGEFGLKVWGHVPQVAHVCHHAPTVVMHEAGEEALYPFAAARLVVDRATDHDRRGRDEHSPWSQKLRRELLGVGLAVIEPTPSDQRYQFIPSPHKAQDVPPIDVVVCPRGRRYGTDKNWPRWGALAAALQAVGLVVGAAGAPDSSMECGCWQAWDHERFLDATIAAMLRARLVVATDAGLAHLAVLCRRPLLMLVHRENLVAPGRDDCGKPYWPVIVSRYLEAGWEPRFVAHAWDEWKRAIGEVVSAATSSPPGGPPH